MEVNAAGPPALVFSLYNRPRNNRKLENMPTLPHSAQIVRGANDINLEIEQKKMADAMHC